MFILVVIAVICLIMGVLFLINRKALERFENSLNKTLMKITPQKDMHYNILGVFLIIFACMLFLISSR